jgi:3-hydroxybutyryl-CoA dehydrogenase
MQNVVKRIGIAGAGTMGAGMAQVTAQAGYTTIIYDISESMLLKAKSSIEKSLQTLVDKQKITASGKDDTLKLIAYKP